ncbi:hypothetical protein [Cupriavidus necator]|uniref:hypothetical protein n=1 Tax=Cupriavidus necator TaxID=106590 RepID=UPI000F4D424E|nr:hypothetical protein [Cupriavidus necator]
MLEVIVAPGEREHLHYRRWPSVIAFLAYADEGRSEAKSVALRLSPACSCSRSAVIGPAR